MVSWINKLGMFPINHQGKLQSKPSQCHHLSASICDKAAVNSIYKSIVCYCGTMGTPSIHLLCEKGEANMCKQPPGAHTN